MEDRFKNSKELAGLKIPFTGKSVTMRYKVIIKAGVEVDQIKFKIDDEKRTLTFTLPKAKILSTEIDTDSIEVEEQNGLFNHTTVEDGTELLKTMKDAAEVSAKKSWITRESERSCKRPCYRFI